MRRSPVPPGSAIFYTDFWDPPGGSSPPSPDGAPNLDYMNPEQQARENIDRLLIRAGWAVQNADAVNLYESAGVAVREFSLKPGHGSADYLLYVNRRAAGIVEAKPEGHTLVGVETQSEKYSTGLPDILPAYRRPLPFLYQSTGVESRFTNLLDPDSRSRSLFAFHKPETLAAWLGASESAPDSHDLDRPMAAQPPDGFLPRNLRRNLRAMPPLDASELWPVQERAIESLERSLAAGRPRALVQMATGSGKTFMACNQIYRLIKHAGARRVLFLVDRSNLGRQALREFQGFSVPGGGRKFTELYNVQLLQSARVDDVSRVCIATIQRVYSMLKGEELDPQLEELSGFELPLTGTEPPPVEYNPDVPIETFDFIITDECHRSIYNLWRQVLEYFDASIIGLTATPSRQTFGFFQQNLVMEYNHRQAVADNINVDFDVYRIRTEITDQGSTVKAGYHVDRRNRLTRKVRWEQLEEDLTYLPNQLDRDVVAEDQIRTIVRTFRDRLFTDIFPRRRDVPKTIIFAKDDSHADDIVRVVRREFDKGNDFCQKITYKTTGARPEDLLSSFRNSYNPRVVVTVDMIATGTDIKPVEIVFFMRNVRSRGFFEQMKGRGVRTISPTDFNAVTPDSPNKDRFVIVDAVGVTENELSDSYSLERKPTISFEKLLDLVSMGDRDPDTLSSLASRLARLDRQLTPPRPSDHRSRRRRRCAPRPRFRSGRRDRSRRRCGSRPAGDRGAGTILGGCRPDRTAAAGRSRPPVRRESRATSDAGGRPPLLRADHRHGQRRQPDRRRLLKRAGRRPGPILQGVHRGEPGRDHRPASALRAPLPAAAGLPRYQGSRRRPPGAAPLLDPRPALGGLPAARRVQGARLRPAGARRHRLARAPRHRRDRRA